MKSNIYKSEEYDMACNQFDLAALTHGIEKLGRAKTIRGLFP